MGLGSRRNTLQSREDSSRKKKKDLILVAGAQRV